MTTQEQDTRLDGFWEQLLAWEAQRHRDEIIQLHQAWADSRQVSIAVGIVMAQEGLDRDEALELLLDASERTGSPLCKVAAEVEESGRLRF